MYVKSVTMKGFKSFASSTALRLEPGITCIVGPNGSGKSNVVDALAWVLGEQGAKSLRGAKMEDVIFAGTAGRPPLGRAEVSLTIDNTDGALPIDYTEVTLSRTMFRAGGSDYAINGTPCRLLDIQELLSDSGIGSEMHVIVGQGQLDAVLRATPEDRRGFIEEAAGVLKHRKRKERALRKLDAMEANLTRIADLSGEIRRQLGPLGRQAETARRAAVVQADARDARLRLLADDLVQLTSTLEQELADETALVERRREVEAQAQAARDRLARLEEDETRLAPLATAAAQRWYTLSSITERIRATGALAAERARLLRQDDQEPAPSTDPERLLSQAEEIGSELRCLQGDLDACAAALQEAVGARTQAEQAYEQEQTRLAGQVRAVADRREGLARLAGRVAAASSRMQTVESSLARLREGAAASQARAAQAGREYAQLESMVASAEAGEEDLDAAYEQTVQVLERANQRVEQLQETERSAAAERTSLAARREALELGLRYKDGAGRLLDAGHGRAPGVLGALAQLVRVEPGYQAAIAAALGWAAEAVAVESIEAAREALRLLREEDAGSVRMLVAGEVADSPPVNDLPAGATAATALVRAAEPLRAAVSVLLGQVVLVPGLDDAVRVVRERPDLTAVTAQGDVLARDRAIGSGESAPGLLETQAAVEDTRRREQGAAQRAERARFELGSARQLAKDADQEAQAALHALHDSDARMSAVAERLGELGGIARAARAEQERTGAAILAAQAELETHQADLRQLQARLQSAEGEPVEHEPSTVERDRLAEQAATARGVETERRLALRTQEERARALRERISSLESAARAQEVEQARAAARADRRRREADLAAAVRRGVELAEPMLVRSVALAEAERELRDRDRVTTAAERSTVRRVLAGLEEQLRLLTDSVHRDEVARAQQRMRIEALRAKAVDELGTDPELLVEDYGPHRLVPAVREPDAPPDAELPQPAPYVRDAQEKRLRSAERKLAQLGRVNPLALEEYAALEERQAFLTRQLEDLRGSRRDLLGIIGEVDERVQRVFADAFADTAAQFEQVFARLFPGGEGRLVLTDPGDLLMTGIEVEARPPGKKIKRLSLLSGGERALVAVALLVSIFRARPSPFYIMDEVEAALDDANLGRLLMLLEELRDCSQLIVITHQKRTMEIADALYGVTMRGDGVSTVVSARMRELADQPA